MACYLLNNIPNCNVNQEGGEWPGINLLMFVMVNFIKQNIGG